MYEKNDEATIKRGYERFMVNFNNTYKFTPWLAASVAGTFQRKKAETSGVTVAELRNLAPYELLLEEDGSYAYNGVLEPVDCRRSEPAKPALQGSFLQYVARGVQLEI